LFLETSVDSLVAFRQMAIKREFFDGDEDEAFYGASHCRKLVDANGVLFFLISEKIFNLTCSFFCCCADHH